MDEKLQEIWSIQPLQEEVLFFRNNQKFLRKVIKQTCIAEAKKLQNVEIVVAETELKLPRPERWPKSVEIEQPNLNPHEMIKDCEQTCQALEFLK